MTETPAEPHATVELQGHTLVVTMNRPEARNALSGEMLRIMEQAWERANADPEVRVVILTGAGGYFCAGADLKAMSASSPSDSFESGAFDPSVKDGGTGSRCFPRSNSLLYAGGE